MSTTTPKYTITRGNIYWLNFRIPVNIYKYSALSSQVVRASLNTSDFDKAGSLAQILVFKLKEHCKVNPVGSINKQCLDNIITTCLIELGAITLESSQISSSKPKPLTISSSFKQYSNEMVAADMWRVKTKCDYCAAVDNFINLIGDITLSSLDSKQCRNYKIKLMRFPLNWGKSLEFKSSRVIDLINSSQPYPTISTTTVNNQMRKVSSFFNWLVKQDLLVNNPLTGMKIRQETSLKAARTSFSVNDLSNIFSSPIYSEHSFLHGDSLITTRKAKVIS